MTNNTDNAGKPPRLIQWAKDGYPPIDLNGQFTHVIALIMEYKKLKARNEELREAVKNLPGYLEDAATALEAFSNRNGNTNVVAPKLNWYAAKIREAITKAGE